jgi:hypothetical protein
VAVTVVAAALAWIGWQVQIVRERKAALAEAGMSVVFTTDMIEQLGAYLPDNPHLPFWRRWLGDKAVKTIAPIGLVPEQCAKLKRLFPEAKVEGLGGFQIPPKS